jgi:hypothetical protein
MAHGHSRNYTTLTDATDKEYALDWRARCRTSLDRRARKLADGDRIRLPEPMKFSDGAVLQEFTVGRRGRRLVLRDPQSGGLYRISRLMDRSWTIIPTTRVHKTLFG